MKKPGLPLPLIKKETEKAVLVELTAPIFTHPETKKVYLWKDNVWLPKSILKDNTIPYWWLKRNGFIPKTKKPQ